RFQTDRCGAIHDLWYGNSWLVKEGPLDYSIAQDWVSKADACGTHWTLPTSTHAATLFSPTQTAGTGYQAKGESY
ncbi:unnamed protein product, partial [Laminaria digitata]